MSAGIRIFLTLILFLVLGGIFLAIEFRKSAGDSLVFCDVGQGDGFIVISGKNQVLFDGGVGTKISQCMAKYIPIWDRKLEAVVLTHPQKDHMEGQIDVFKRFDVSKVIYTGAEAEGSLFEEWSNTRFKEGAENFELRRGDKFVAGNFSFEVLWPTKSFMDLWKIAPGSDLNETSFVIRLSKSNFCAYLTGDITVELLEPLIDKSCQILKVGHHGSKTSTNHALVNKIKPAISIIQLGRNNYGHPHKEVIDAFGLSGSKILRNDLEGDIKINIQEDGVYLVD